MRKRPGEKRDNWLLIKSDDDAARGPDDPDILEEKPKSVVSGRTIEAIAKAEGDAVWHSTKSVAENVKQIQKAAKPKKKASPAVPKKNAARNASKAKAKSRAHLAAFEVLRQTPARARRASALPDFIPPQLATLRDDRAERARTRSTR